MEYAEEFQSSIGEALESINNINAKCSNITPSPIYISTMTVNCVTNLKSIDVDMIREKHNAAINPGDFLDSSIELANKSGHFRNCIILKVIFLKTLKTKDTYSNFCFFIPRRASKPTARIARLPSTCLQAAPSTSPGSRTHGKRSP